MRVAVIGAGHNGLIASYFLRKAGLDVVVFEASSKVGGMVETVEVMGVKVSRASYVLGLMPKKLLEEFSIPLIEQDPIQTIYLDKPIPFWRDKQKRVEELERAGESNFREFEELMCKFKSLMERKFTFVTEPPSEEEVREEARKEGVEELMRLTVKEFLNKYLSKELHEFFYYPGMEDSPAYLVAYFYAPWSYVRGGMGTVADRIREKAEQIGVQIRLNSRVEEVVGKEKVKGVKVNGKVLDFDVVVLAGSPLLLNELTDLKLDVKMGYSRWVKYNVVFKDKPKLPENLKPFASSILDTYAGEIVLPSFVDDSLGGHVMEMMGDIDEALDMIKGEVVYEEKLTARDAEREYFLPYGNLNHLPMAEPYLFDGRPVKGWGYTTPIKGLYLTGAGTYPGGQVTGIPGYNAAMKVLKDLSLKNP
ncbi:MAG: FAD dependent oxidoreductase [Candidatus Aramenus sulfurataquae]|uniref:Pyridine nucleotide-disulfide oxidoreductase domain-containing protein 2 n=1 Tax=Candidatus Aramenus sulfurataquae TaxID=1326980 RepID=W7KYT3_9CREN|nr:MAG: FAD dependent oxidoreductase [Candidatus Aramenus sulfurataquae]